MKRSLLSMLILGGIFILLFEGCTVVPDYRMMVNKFIEKDIPWVDGSFKNAAEVFGQLAEYSKHVTRWKHRAA